MGGEEEREGGVIDMWKDMSRGMWSCGFTLAASSLSQEMSNVSAEASSICKDGGSTAYTQERGNGQTYGERPKERQRQR